MGSLYRLEPRGATIHEIVGLSERLESLHYSSVEGQHGIWRTRIDQICESLVIRVELSIDLATSCETHVGVALFSNKGFDIDEGSWIMF